MDDAILDDNDNSIVTNAVHASGSNSQAFFITIYFPVEWIVDVTEEGISLGGSHYSYRGHCSVEEF